MEANAQTAARILDVVIKALNTMTTHAVLVAVPTPYVPAIEKGVNVIHPRLVSSVVDSARTDLIRGHFYSAAIYVYEGERDVLAETNIKATLASMGGRLIGYNLAQDTADV